MKDLYEILNIEKQATGEQIKKAYKKLAFKNHPDKNKSPDAENKFQDISEAYEILMNTDKRRMYDNFGYESVSGEMGGSVGINPIDLFQSLFNVDFAGETMNSNIFVFSDLSTQPFGPLVNKMTYNLECTLDELYNGAKKEFSIFHMTKKGKKSTKYIINIKKGSKHDDNILVKEGGNYIPEMDITEDLVIKIVEIEHIKYKRKDNDLFIQEKISLCEALTGCSLYIEHLDGPLQVNITDIIKPNQMFQVFGKGMPIKMDDKSLTDADETIDYGNLVIDLIIDFPESLSEKQSELLTKILVKLPRQQNKGLSCQGYYYKDKSAPIKELMNNDSDDEMGESGCIQQ